MIIKEEVKLGEISRELMRLTDSGALTSGMGVALRSVVSSVLRTVYGTEWREITVAGLDTERIFDEFVAKRARDGNGMHAKSVYYARFKRAMMLFAESLGKDVGSEKTDTNIDDMLRKLLDSINAMQEVLMPDLLDAVFRPTCRNEYELYGIPAGDGKVAALALPKNLSLENLRQINSLMSGIFICEEAKKKGGL